jgi:hypothetical protein
VESCRGIVWGKVHALYTLNSATPQVGKLLMSHLMKASDLRALCTKWEQSLYPAISVNVWKTIAFILRMLWHTGCHFLLQKRGSTDMKNLRKMIGGAILTLAVIFGLSTATSMTAHAQYRVDRDDQYQRRDRNRDYRDQNQDWRRDRNNVYGNNGYGNNGYGNNGYNNSYRVAMNQGYQYGLNTGASDAQRGQSYSPQRSRYFQNASSQAFRDGFVQGYDQGFRQYGGNQRSRTGSIFGRIFGQPY